MTCSVSAGVFGETAGRQPPARCRHAECSPASRPCATEDFIGFIAPLGRKIQLHDGCMQLHSLTFFDLRKDKILAGTSLATEATFRQLVLALQKFLMVFGCFGSPFCFSSAMRF